jgi:hypothetical protein
MLDDAVLDDAPASADAMDTPAGHDDRAERLHRAAGCYGEMARTAACWAHPSWLATPLGLSQSAAAKLQEKLAHGSHEHMFAVSAALLQHCRVGPAPFAALAARSRRKPSASGSAALLCLVPPATRMRMLCMRALLGHADELRRMIDRPARLRLSQAIGVPLSEFIARTGGSARSSSAGELASLAADDLAAAGYAALVADRAPPGRFAALAMPCDRVFEPAVPAAPAAPTGGPSLGSSWAALLPDLFPEWTWLFG